MVKNKKSQDRRSLEAYMGSWSRELEASCHRVRHLIGHIHWLTDGRHKERILWSLLIRVLPPFVRMCNGFIMGPPPRSYCSGEIDLYFHDDRKGALIFDENGVSVAQSSSVSGWIHVKSELTLASLKDVVEANTKIRETCELDNGHCLSTAFFFGSDLPVFRIKEALIEYRNAGRFQDLPCHICVLGEFNLILSGDPWKHVIAKNIAVAVFLNELLAVHYPDSRTTLLHQGLEALNLKTENL